jgi:hypothetical protein
MRFCWSVRSALLEPRPRSKRVRIHAMFSSTPWSSGHSLQPAILVAQYTVGLKSACYTLDFQSYVVLLQCQTVRCENPPKADDAWRGIPDCSERWLRSTRALTPLLDIISCKTIKFETRATLTPLGQASRDATPAHISFMYLGYQPIALSPLHDSRRELCRPCYS